MPGGEPPTIVIYEHPSGKHCAIYLRGELVLEGHPDGLGRGLIDALAQEGLATVFWEDTYLLGGDLSTADCAADSLAEIAYYCQGEVGARLELMRIDQEIDRLQTERTKLEARMAQ